MLRINGIKLTPQQAQKKREERRYLKEKAAKLLRVDPDCIKTFNIAKKSIDARNKGNVFVIYSLDVWVKNKVGYLGNKNVAKVTVPEYEIPKCSGVLAKRPVVVGSGPAGLFAAVILAEAGQCPIIIERGKDADNRAEDVNRMFSEGILNPESNIQFGEGGAGTFSDGKLTTSTKDVRIAKVLQTLIDCSAPEEIAYLAKPHIGTDILLRVLKQAREHVTALGGEYLFESKLIGIEQQGGKLCGLNIEQSDGKQYMLETDYAVLAIGHSARDTFEMLHGQGLNMKAKSFAVGVRIEHPQESINTAQHGKFAEFLPPADYKLTHRAANGRGVYTFCMCPGGLVIPAASEQGRLAINGMSNYRRDGVNANSAILVQVTPEDFGSNPLDGIAFQRRLEEQAFKLGGGNFAAPVQRVGDFLQDRATSEFGGVTPSYRPNATPADLRMCLDGFIIEALKDGITAMGRKLQGFDDPDAILTAVESRSSSPLTILRDEQLNSSIVGLIPCGEGAGYAGGIMSAAVDGIRCAEQILLSVR